MSYSFNFTKNSLVNIEPASTRKRYRDSGGTSSVHGLGLEVTKTGTKTFNFIQKVNGKNLQVTLGRFPEITVEQARRLAREVVHKIASGVNPNEEKRTARNYTTFEQLFEYYEASFKLDIKAGKRRESSLKGHEILYRLHIRPKLGKRTIDNFAKDEAKTFLQNILAKKGYSLHNHSLTLLKSMFNRADIENNPFATLKKIDESVFRRERTLSKEELCRLLDSLEQEEPIYQDCILLLLLTGQRKSNVLAMEWSEINKDARTWVIPVNKIKTKKPHVVPLSHEAMKVLERRSLEAEKGQQYVFPSTRSATGHIADKSGIGGFWNRITKRAGLYDPNDASKNLQVHDLRRTLATYQVTSGGSLQATSRLLGHSNIGVTASVYAHLSVDHIRTELEHTTRYMLSSPSETELNRIKAEISRLTQTEQAELFRFMQETIGLN
ncbi:tyrosine-type recombinase/integrase [Vibrio rumoiensis]|uniref:Integrase n=1 Tax=Vibrio rumoiensis 1S-45 TaxID=1188252 RepID=A0A1E5E3S0_9VIBR|nr:integrase family protein [Vibrio rumoiensis]OEF26995.1 integrase [Vibrio rumoiensis 1S-45]